MSLNKLLLNKDRELLKDRIDLMFRKCPDMMSRKISEANVQQAFVLDTVLSLSDAVFDEQLCVGSFEDTAMETLIQMGYTFGMCGIDPAINEDLDSFHSRLNGKRFWDIIFSTSVIEHVQDDELFISQICDLLAPKGYAVLTCDFNNDYVDGAPVPATVVRQYTKKDLEERLPAVLAKHGCNVVGVGDWEGEPDFIYQGHLYSFATFVFRKGSTGV